MKAIRIVAVCACVVLVASFFLPILADVKGNEDLIKWDMVFLNVEAENSKISLFNIVQVLRVLITPDSAGTVDIGGVPIGGFSTYSGANAVFAGLISLFAAFVVIPVIIMIYILRKKIFISLLLSLIYGSLIYLLAYHVIEFGKFTYDIAYYSYLCSFVILFVCSFSLFVMGILQKRRQMKAGEAHRLQY